MNLLRISFEHFYLFGRGAYFNKILQDSAGIYRLRVPLSKFGDNWKKNGSKIVWSKRFRFVPSVENSIQEVCKGAFTFLFFERDKPKHGPSLTSDTFTLCPKV